MYQGFLLWWLCCDELVHSGFNAIYIFCGCSSCKPSPSNGNKLCLLWVLCCDFPSKEGFVLIRLIADIMVGLQESYMSSMFESSTCNVDISWVSADGCWFRNWRSWCVLISCLLNDFQLYSRCPRETCAVISHELHVGYAFRSSWKRTDSPNSLPDEVVVRVIMNRML